MGRRGRANSVEFTARSGRLARRLFVVVGALVGLTAAVAAADDDGSLLDGSLLERHNLTGDWNGVRPLLSSHGFEPYLTYTGTLWANLAGGRQTGVEPNGYLDFGLEVDLAKLGTWQGLGFHIDFHWWQGDEPTKKLIGGLLAMALSDWEAA